MSHTRITAVMLAASVLAFAGCSESSRTSSSASLTLGELIAKADAICARVHAQYHANGYKSFSDIARLAPRVAAFERTGAGELSVLVPPASLAKDWKQIVGGLQTRAENTAKLGQAAKAGDRAALTSLIAAATKTQQQALAIAAHDGFKDCARAS